MKAAMPLGIICVILVFLLTLTACKPAETPAPKEATSMQPAAQQPIPGPVPGTRMTEAYVSQMGRSIYFWAWPMMNVHNRKVQFVCGRPDRVTRMSAC
jgi:hypothetical protein